jgi:hypothetical protein
LIAIVRVSNCVIVGNRSHHCDYSAETSSRLNLDAADGCVWSLYHLLQDDGVTGTWRRNPSQGKPSAARQRDSDEADESDDCRKRQSKYDHDRERGK